MIEHKNPPAMPVRTVAIGAGFVGGAIAEAMRARGGEVLALRRDFDLLAPDAAERLAALLRPTDSVVAVAAKAPVKNPSMLVDCVRMAGAMAAAIERVKPAHVLYVSSDAVYADGPLPLTEASPLLPGALHGHMHVVREAMFAACGVPLAILRPTLVYGAADPHKGYGPNRFARQAKAGETIALFGEGEERRDHIAVEDVAELAVRLLERGSTGALNAATGRVASFRAIAERIAALAPVPVRGGPRVGPMPHGGYRPFDPAGVAAAFPDFRFRAWEEGVAALVLPSAPR
jgi:UDP-glucose 4-epimerase